MQAYEYLYVTLQSGRGRNEKVAGGEIKHILPAEEILNQLASAGWRVVGFGVLEGLFVLERPKA